MAFNMNPTRSDGYARINYPFNGVLNPNEVFGSIYNMIISQTVRYPELADNYGFVEMFRDEGSLFGDTKVYYAQDVLKSREWTGDNEASNLLAIERPEDPECQAITINQFRMVKTSLDNYLTKRAWSTEGAFSTFQEIVRSMVGQTKKLYEVTLINTYLGSVHGNAAKSEVEVPLSDITATGEEKNRLEAQTIAQHLADLMVEMKDYSRDFNDYEFMRAYTEDELIVVWNSAYVNKINKLDLPTIFNKSGVMDKFAQHILPARYFSKVTTDDNVTGVSGLTKVDNAVTIGAGYKGTVITYKEGDYMDTAKGKLVHKFIGEKLPVGATFTIGEAGILDEGVICKVITKDTIKYMAAFEVSTEFWNPQALVSSNMLIWGYSEPTRLYDQPCVTVHAD